MKRLSKTSGQGAQEFKNEAVLVTKFQHRNLVGVLGFCLYGEEKNTCVRACTQQKPRLFSFRYDMSLKNYKIWGLLDEFLMKLMIHIMQCADSAKKGSKLGWTRRYNIIGGIARGVLYLKASNILLDEPQKSTFWHCEDFQS